MELGQYKGVEVKKADAAVTDEDVEKEIESIRDRNARIITVEDRPAASGDIAVIDFEGSINGEPFDGGKAENYSLAIGSGTFIPVLRSRL